MAEPSPQTSIRGVVESNPRGRELLYEHGYDLGTGFVDLLSQEQTLEEAARSGRLRDLPGLLTKLSRR